MTREVPINTHTVEYFPSADDYAYIATRVSGSVPTPQIVTYAYQGFLLVNAIAFPAFLWYHNYFYAGLFVLIADALMLYWILPWFGSLGLKRFYDHSFGNREKRAVRVDLNLKGLTYTSDGGTLFLPWRKIQSIEESDESLFF